MRFQFSDRFREKIADWVRYGLPGPGDIWVHLRFLWYTRQSNRLIPVSLMIALLTISILFSWLVANNNQAGRDIHCLALNVYHEARGEPESGQYAVAQVTLNRVFSPRYPDTVCDAVYQQNWDRIRKRMVGAFSWTELEDLEQPKGKAWEGALMVAENSYYKRKPDLVWGAVFYHARYIKPKWAKNKTAVASYGRHVFYR